MHAEKASRPVLSRANQGKARQNHLMLRKIERMIKLLKKKKLKTNGYFDKKENTRK